MSKKIQKLQDAQFIDYESESEYSEEESLNEEEVQQRLNQIKQDDQVQEFGQQQLQDIINQLEKDITKNQELRVKFLTTPKYFMESEIQLDQDIKNLSNIAAYPELLKQFTESSGIKSLMQLLQHQNIDLVIDVVKLLSEISQMETDNIKDHQILFDQLLSNKLLELLLFLLNNQLDEKKLSQKKCVYQVFEIIENIIEICPYVIQQLLKSDFMEYLLDRVNTNIGIIDDNRLYASELLATMFAQIKQQIIIQDKYMRKFIFFIQKFMNATQPSEEELETFENVSDCLTKALIISENQINFQKLDGIQTILQLLQTKNDFSPGALKIIDYAILKNAYNQKQLIDQQGLKYLSAIINRKGSIYLQKAQRYFIQQS